MASAPSACAPALYTYVLVIAQPGEVLVFHPAYALVAARQISLGPHADAKSILPPMSSMIDLLSVLGKLFAKFHTRFYSHMLDTVFKASGVE